MISPADDVRREPRWAFKLSLWIAILGVVALAIYQTKPPDALDEAAPPEQFSAARAKIHLQQIAREPHPIGTAANQRVRDYVVEALAALGADVQVQTTIGITDARRQIYGGTAQNIFATIKGTANSRAVMLTTHHDSVPQAPGAADAGAGIATILETIRALRVSGPLKNDLLVLVTDGEEEGLIGAAAFVRDHPEIVERVGLVMNFEARGTSGPVLMFETSDQNGWLAREFARVAPRPFSSSLAYAVYKNLPNQTDMTVFKMAGMAGLNFAFNASLENYHTRRDSTENLDPRSLQHLGSNALALTRHFGNLELRDVRAPDRIYFNWFGSWLVDYPQWVSWPVLLTVLALLVAAVRIGRRTKALTIRGTLFGTVGFLVVLLAALAGPHFVWWVVRISTSVLLVGDTASNSLITIACLTAALAVVLAVQSWLAAKLGRWNSAVGQLLTLAVLTVVLTCALPAASYVLQWPLLFALAGVVAALLLSNGLLPAFLGSLPALLIYAPLMYLLFVTLGFDSIAVSALAILLALLLALMSPLLPQISRRLSISVPVLLLCSAAFAISGVRLSRFSPEHPRPNSLFYAIDADAQRAAWVSFDNEIDRWTQQFLTSAPRRGNAPGLTVGSSRDVLSTDAELLPLEPPSVTVISDSSSRDGRLIKLHVASPRNANTLLLRFPGEVRIQSVAMNGRSYQIRDTSPSSAPWLLRYNALPPEGVELELQLAPIASFTCWVGDRAFGLPELQGKPYPPRPPDMMSTYGSDVTLVSRSLKF